MASEYLDDRVLPEDCVAFEYHVRRCSACADYVEDNRRMVSSLKRMQAHPVPARLELGLRVVAARERMRATQATINWRDRIQLAFRNLMQPVALPAMGGIISAIVLFSIIMPSIAIHVNPQADDPPTNLFTDASAKYLAPIGLSESELLIDVMVDSDGRVAAYRVVGGEDVLVRDPALKRQLENNLLFTEFTPATLLGGRTSGRVRLQIKSDHINIRG